MSRAKLHHILVSALLSLCLIPGVASARSTGSQAPMVRLQSASSEVVNGKAQVSFACERTCRGYARIERLRGHVTYGQVRFAHARGSFTATVTLRPSVLRTLNEYGEVKARVVLDVVSGNSKVERTGAVMLVGELVGKRASEPASSGGASSWIQNMGISEQEWLSPMPEALRKFAGYSVGDYSERDSMRSVQGVLTVPSIMTCPTVAEVISIKDSEKSTATWVGLSGTATVEQAGVYSTCSGNIPAYLPFVDMYPTPVTFVPMKVKPGEQVLAEVTQVSAPGAVPQQFLATLRDLTTGAVFSQVFTQPTTGPVELAEWLTDLQPSTWPTLSTLTWSDMNFSAMNGASQAKSDELSGSYWEVREPIQRVCASPSALSATNNSFTLAWAPCAAMPGPPRQH